MTWLELLPCGNLSPWHELLTARWPGFQRSVPGVSVPEGRKLKLPDQGRALLGTVMTLFPQYPIDENNHRAHPGSRVWRNKVSLLLGEGAGRLHRWKPCGMEAIFGKYDLLYTVLSLTCNEALQLQINFHFHTVTLCLIGHRVIFNLFF